MRTCLYCLLIAVLLTSRVALGQDTNASLTGRVVDPAGAVVPGAQVKVSSYDRGTTFTEETNSDGIYYVSSLPPGIYRIDVARVGFRTVIKPDVVLNVQDVRVVNFSLQVGSVQESVTVTAESTPVNTTDASVSAVVDRRFVENMPLNGRSFQALIELAPGVVAAAATGNNPGQFSINGQRTDANYFTIDGVSAHVGVSPSGAIGTAGSGSTPATAATGGFNSLVSVDALQEFRIQTSTFAPEFGRTPGGQISIVTRSGTNQFHGILFDYLRNNVFDAKDWFTNYGGLKQPALRQNDFGSVFGGPIKKNRLFFFLSYEGLRLRQATPAVVGSGARVPSLCLRGLAPSTGPTSCTATGGTPASAGMIPYLQGYPLPTGNVVSNDPNLALFAANLPSTTQLDAGSARVDYKINDSMMVFGRYNRAPSETFSQLTSLRQFLNIPAQTFTAGHTWTLNPSMVNDLRFNYSDTSAGRITDDAGTFMGAIPPPSSAVFLNPSFTSPGDAIALQFIANGMSGYQINNHSGNERQKQYNIVDSFSIAKGSHQLKSGVDWRQLTPVFSGMPYRASLFFAPGEVNIFNGLVNRVVVNTEPGETYRFTNYSFYGQDTWRIYSRLTMTYGVRWDINPAPSSPNGTPPYVLTHFDPNNIGATTLAPFLTSSGAPASMPAVYQTEWHALAPRIGFAYQLSTSAQWQRVVRGGFGLFYDTADDVSGELFGPYTTQLSAVLNPPVSIGALAGNAALNPAAVSLTAPFVAHTNMDDPNLKLPYFYQMNVAVEQALGTSQTITATYVGSIGRNLTRTQSYAPPLLPPALFPSGITVFTNGGTSDYHALQLRYQRRLSRGLQVLGDYTWAHSIDTASAYTSGFGSSPASLNAAQDRGPSDFDIRHAVHAALSYDLPTPWKHNRFANGLLGHWAIEDIYQFRTANPFDLYSGSQTIDPTTGTLVIARPNYVGGPIWLYGNVCTSPQGIPNSPCPGGRVLNYNAFAQPAVGQQGNFPRNALRAFGLQQLDMTLRRDIPITERWHMQIRCDAFNLTNHPNFAPPANSLAAGPSSFGIVSSTLATYLGGGPGGGGYNPLYSVGANRSIQWSAKLIF